MDDIQSVPDTRLSRLNPCTLTTSAKKVVTRRKPKPRLRYHNVPKNTDGLTVFSESEGEESIQTETILEPDPGVFSLEDLCRVCASVSGDTLEIFGTEGTEQQLQTKINLYLPIKVAEGDALPVRICHTCASVLEQSHALATVCLLANDTLTAMLREQQELFQQESNAVKTEDSPSDCDVNSSHEDADLHQENTSDNETAAETSDVATPKPTIKPNFFCKICNKSYNTRNYLTRHCRKCHSSILCRVKTCFESFSDKADLELHFTKTHKEGVAAVKRLKGNRKNSVNYKPCVCEQCGKVFSQRSNLSAHINFQHLKKEGNYPCGLCDKKFRSTYYLKTHLKRHNGIKDLECNICGKTFYDKDTLKTHKESHSKTKKYQCLQCNSSFKTRQSLRVHKLKAHEQSWMFNCNVCNDVYTNESDVARHYYKHTEIEKSTNKTIDMFHKTSPHQCETCYKYFGSKYYLKFHIQNIHPNQNVHLSLESTKNNGEEQQILHFECNVCFLKFKNKGNLKSHLGVHRQVKPLTCTYCNKTFRSKQFLIVHTRSHTKETPFVCSTCGDSFTSKLKMKLHVQKIHEQIRKHECSFCGKKFFVKDHLKIHFRTHTNERPYACQMCPQKFKQSIDLKRHVARHAKKSN